MSIEKKEQFKPEILVETCYHLLRWARLRKEARGNAEEVPIIQIESISLSQRREALD